MMKVEDAAGPEVTGMRMRDYGNHEEENEKEVASML